MDLRPFLKPLILLPILVLCTPALQAKQDEVARIERLLRVVEIAHTAFILDGTLYTAEEMARHLRDKLKKSDMKNLTTDDFISRLANSSSHSGKPYKVVLENGQTTYAGPWLRELLHEIERGNLHGATEETAPAQPINP